MATTGIADKAPTPARKMSIDRLLGRDRLARLVVVGSFLTIFLLIVAVLGLAQSQSSATTTAKDVFNTILPVLASWVGTVLAFYFSAASQELTSASLNQAIGKNAAAPDGALVAEKMIAFAKIAKLQKLDENRPESIKLSDLWNIFYNEKTANGGTISRIMFVEHGIFKFVLHVGPFNAFLLKRVSAGTPPQAGAPVPPGVPPAPSAAGAAAASAAGGAAASAPTPVPTPPKTDSKVLPPAWLDGMTFADMIQDQELVMQISKLVVFVSGAATLAEAKAALDRVSGAQDIIVTATGDGTEPMLGWLTNVDLTKALQVS